MKLTFLTTMSALCILNLGCTLSDNLLRTSVIQPIQYSTYWDLKLERRRFRKLAQVELERARITARAESDNYACPPFSVDEEKGFEAGFVDYLAYGGTGNPPPLPPRRYWWSGCENPSEYDAIQDWFRGFQHGAAVAQASGYRNCVMVPLSDGLSIDTLPIYYRQISETDYAEPIETPPSILESAEPLETPPGELDSSTSVHVEIPNLPVTSTSTNNLQPLVPAESLPSGWEHLLLNNQSPSVDQNVTTGEFTPASAKNDATSLASESLQWPRARAPRSPMPANRSSDSLPALEASGFAGVPDLIEIKRTPVAQKPSTTPPPPALAAPQNAPVRSTPIQGPPIQGPPIQGPPIQGPLIDRSLINGAWPYLKNDGLIERDAAPQTPPVPGTTREEARSTEPATPTAMHRVDEHPTIDSASAPVLTEPRRTMLAGALLLVAGGFLIVRRPRVSLTSTAHQPHADTRQRSPLPMNACPTASIPETSTKCSEPGRPSCKRITSRERAMMILAFACCWMTGCSSLTNPVLNGIPVRKLPPELLSQTRRDNLQTIPLSMLRQRQPDEYLLAAGDVLAVYIAGVFPPTTADQPLASPPVYFPSQIDPLGAGLPPSMGYPVTIRNDGTLSLPLVDPISLDGLTVEQANERVRDAYANKGILQPGRESVMLTLMQPRQIRVLVFRQEVGGFSAGGRGDISANNIKQGTGHIVDLRAYENDVVNALANSGGLPGLDSYAGVYIFRDAQSNLDLTQKLETLHSGKELEALSNLSVQTDYIPIRWLPTEPAPFQPEDVVLHEGDVVLLEARIEDLFYTAGLLPAGERKLPRDYDLDVVEAVVQVSGSLVNGAFGGNNFNGLLIQKGIGNPNPSALTVIRRTPNGGQIPISVDLNRALVDPRERILVQPGDLLILQETRNESVARYFNSLFNFNVFWQVFTRGDATGATAITQLPSI